MQITFLPLNLQNKKCLSCAYSALPNKKLFMSIQYFNYTVIMCLYHHYHPNIKVKSSNSTLMCPIIVALKSQNTEPTQDSKAKRHVSFSHSHQTNFKPQNMQIHVIL